MFKLILFIGFCVALIYVGMKYMPKIRINAGNDAGWWLHYNTKTGRNKTKLF